MSDFISFGSHLVTKRIGYNHHGLYIGEQQVIHLTRANKVEIVSFAQFTQGQDYRVEKYQSHFTRAEIVQRAKSYLGDESYSLLFNNCEHFVNKCIYDVAYSEQVNDAAMTTANAGIVANQIMQTSAVISAGGLVTSTAMTSGLTLLSATPIAPAAIVGLGVFKIVQWLSD